MGYLSPAEESDTPEYSERFASPSSLQSLAGVFMLVSISCSESTCLNIDRLLDRSKYMKCFVCGVGGMSELPVIPLHLGAHASTDLRFDTDCRHWTRQNLIHCHHGVRSQASGRRQDNSQVHVAVNVGDKSSSRPLAAVVNVGGVVNLMELVTDIITAKR